MKLHAYVVGLVEGSGGGAGWDGAGATADLDVDALIILSA